MESLQAFWKLGLLSSVLLVSASASAAPDCSRAAGSLPRPWQKAGAPDPTNPIEHIVVSMQENHSFDEYFGRLNDPEFYGDEVDGVLPSMSNKGIFGIHLPVFHRKNLCVWDTDHDWKAEHKSWNEGKNDGFGRANGRRAMGYFDHDDLAFYYGLANQFAIGDRYFCSAITKTYPNRFFLLTGTAFGHITNDKPNDENGFEQKTIFDLLEEHGITWRYYSNDGGYLNLFQHLSFKYSDHLRTIAEYHSDLRQDLLPQVAFLESDEDVNDEHPPQNVRRGEAWEAQQIHALMDSSAWKTSVYFLLYDENGGFFDHVAPPEACAPDNVAGDDELFDRYGFRVPFVAVSPYVKHHFVSHQTYDHTSVLRFIENKFNLPALTARDANANGFDDLFDFAAPPIVDVQPIPDSRYRKELLCLPEFW